MFAFLGALRRLALVNLLCFLVLVPVLSWFYLLVNTYVHAGRGADMVDLLPGLGYFAGLLFRLPVAVFYCLLVLSAVLSGPCLLGLHAMAGRIVSRRHVWVSDFFFEARRNARQGVVLGVFCVVAGHLMLWNVFGGLTSDVSWIAVLLTVSRGVSVVLFLLFGISFPFVCQVAVSLEQPLWAVVKNGVILGRVRLGRGFLLLFGLGVYWWTTIVTFPVLSLFVLPLISIGLTALVQAAVSRSVVERYLVEPRRRMG